jgi:hypothetical protein
MSKIWLSSKFRAGGRVARAFRAQNIFMRSLRNLSRFLRELFAFAREHKAWWIVPVVILLLLIALLVVSVSAISPFIYSLF